MTDKPEIDFPGGPAPAELVITDITVGEGARPHLVRRSPSTTSASSTTQARSSTRHGTAASRSSSRSGNSSRAGRRASPV